ncbi:hypothetical protein AEBR_0599 [Halarcobacter ebronensis]|uniref:Uncharacterized protein n=1 Tax=Halarcobacter ebronensis TaxID=1462615 RepID=A0A4Q1ALX9_9BACT|nr:hypothetical protein AEBR_0599 [Halarcobacter ebronensis]RXK06411.1 hypothetical protein CRV07_06885 [Halarcobacter ebronensis]
MLSLYKVYNFLITIALLHFLFVDFTIFPYLVKFGFIDAYHPTIVNIALMLAILLVFSRLKKTRIAFPITTINLLFFSFFFLLIFENINAVVSMDFPSMTFNTKIILNAMTILVVLFSMKYIYEKEKILDLILKPYIYLVIIMSIFSFVAFILIISNSVDLTAWIVDKSLVRGIDNDPRGIYSFPLYLSLLDIDSNNSFTIFGLPTLKLSSWCKEPQQFAFLASPVIFLIHLINIKRKVLFQFFIIFAVILTSSLTAYIILLMIFILYTLFKSKFSFKVIGLVFIVFSTIWLVDYIENTTFEKSIFNKFTSSTGLQSIGIHHKMLISENFIGTSISGFNTNYDDSEGSFITSILYYSFVGIILVLAMRLIILNKNKERYLLGFTLLYFIVHFTKSTSYLYITFVFYILFISSMVMESKKLKESSL